MIYLFCNEGYGEAFLKAAEDFNNLYKHKVKITVVYSAPVSKPKSFLRGIQIYVKEWRRNKNRKKTFRNETGLDFLLTKNVNSWFFRKKINSDDFGVIAGFNQIFDCKTIARFKSLINIHPSILPFYRGPVPSYWCIQNNENKTGYSFHQVTEKIDTGEIIFQEEIAREGVCDPELLDKMIAKRAAKTFLKYLEYLVLGTSWNKVILDATKIYKNCVSYASFPKESASWRVS